MVEWFAFGIGSAGLLLAGISLLWQRHTYHQTRKESAKATISLDQYAKGEFHWCVNVINTGDPPLYIKEVSLVFKLNEGTKNQIFHQQTISCEFNPTTPKKEPLQPNDRQKYLLSDEFAQKTFSSQDPQA